MVFSNGTIILALVLGATAWTLSPAFAAECPVEPARTANAPAYGKVGSRCEGFLPVLVTARLRIELIGLHRGVWKVDGTQSGPVRLRVAAKQPSDGLAIRATFRTKQLHYQMDTLGLTDNRAFEWSHDLLATAKQEFVAASSYFAFLACDSNCGYRPGTTFWPVTTAKVGESATGPIVAILRSNVEADRVTVRLRSAAGDGTGAVVPIDKGFTLQTGRATVIQLPRVPPGAYALIVNAKAVATDDDMSPMVAQIRITGDDE
jgi:hypothetical protein